MPTPPPDGVTASPFSQYLDPANPVYKSTAAPPSGFTGGGGQALNIADHFLEGLSRGRAMKFARSEQENQLGQKAISQAIQDVQSSQLSDQDKQTHVAKLQGMLGQMVYHSIDDPEKKGKGDDQPQGIGHHVSTALKGMLGDLIGPGGQKSPIDKKDLMGSLQGVYQTLQDPNNTIQAQGGKIDQQLWQEFDSAVKDNGGKTPTTAQLMQRPAFFKTYSAALSLNGKPTPGISAIMNTVEGNTAYQEKLGVVNATQGAEDKRAAATSAAATERAKYTADQTNVRERETQSALDARELQKEKAEAPFKAAEVAKNRAEAGLANIKAKNEANGGSTGDMANSIADAIASGQQPPTLRGLYKMEGPVQAALAKKGFNLATAQSDWNAVQKHIATLNSTQQERLRQAITFTSDSIPQVENLYAEWKATGLPGGFKDFNKAALVAASHLPGKQGAVAQNLLTQINDLTSEMGTVYKGGNSSTDESLKLASSNLSADWNEETFARAIKQLKTNVQLRKNSISSSMPAGVTPNSPYLPPTQTPPGGGTPKPAPQQSAGGPPPPAANGAAPQPPTPGAPISKDVMMKYLHAAGGDVNKAKAMAAQDKWGAPQ